MKQNIEVPGLVFGGLGVLFFWVPPVGLAFGAAGLIISITQYKLQRRFRKTAIVLSSLGVIFFAAFWGMIWALSQ
jgi:hypothetical protein